MCLKQINYKKTLICFCASYNGNVEIVKKTLKNFKQFKIL